MRLEQLAKDPGSEFQGCPSVWNDHDTPDDCVVQGEGLDIALLPNPLPGEAAVRIKRSILIEAMRRYQT